jgi:hypothetical protein
MPPRFRYWTVVIDGVITAFRANEPQELVPTLRQLQRHAPGALLMWVENGRLWRSPEEARRAAVERRRPRPGMPTSARGATPWRRAGSGHGKPRRKKGH